MKKSLSALLILASLFMATEMALADFPDVPPEHPNYTAINYVKDKFIVNGYLDGTYKPDLKINRAEFTKIIVGAVYGDQEIYTCKTSNFPDVTINIWYGAYICVAYNHGVIDGYPDGNFKPDQQINLAEASKIIVNAFGIQTQPHEIWYKPYIEALENLGALPLSLSGFEHKLTRGEMAEIIYRILAEVSFKNTLTYTELAEGPLPTEDEKAQALIIDRALTYEFPILNLHKSADKQYNEFVFSFGENMGNNFFDFTRKSLQNYINALKSLKSKITAVESYGGDNTLVEGLLKNVDAKIEILTEDFPGLIDLYEQLSQLNENSTEAEVNELIDSMNALGNTIAQKVETSDDAMMQIYIDFAHRYGIPMQDINAMNYFNGMSNFFNQALNAFSVYQTFAIDIGLEGDLDILEEQRTLSIKQLENIRDQALNVGPYNQDNTFLDAVLQVIDARIYILSEIDSKIINLYKEYQQSPETFTQEDFNTLDTLDSETLKKIDSSIASYFQGIREFSERYGFLEYIESSLPN